MYDFLQLVSVIYYKICRYIQGGPKSV